MSESRIKDWEDLGTRTYLLLIGQEGFPLGQGSNLHAFICVPDQEVGHRGGPTLTAQTVVGPLQGFDLNK